MVEANPFAILTQMAGGYSLARSLHVVANLGVADALDETPQTARALAASVNAHPEALHRVLRLLSAHGVFQVEGETIGHSPASRLLRTDHPQSMRAFAQMFGLPVMWTTVEALEDSVRTGRPAESRAFPEGFWDYLAQRPDEGRVFNSAMVAKAHSAIAGILASYDFSGFSTIADIGGGNGHLLRGILEVVPRSSGILFDLPHVIEQSGSIASDRLTLMAGDFFHDPLPGSDAYLLMEIIHDWGDEEAVAILQAVRQAAPRSATLLVVEAIVPDDPGPDWTKMLDIHMLALFGGRQRSLPEYEALLTQSGFQFKREIDTGAGISILEAEIR